MEVARKRRSSQSFRHGTGSTRGNPEGNSINYKDRYVLQAPPNSDNDDESIDSGVSTLRRRKRKSQPQHLTPIEEKYIARKSRRRFSDSDVSALNISDTPDSLSQISSICPVSDTSLMTTFSTHLNYKMPKPHAARARQNSNTTWEQAVDMARGQPDGAEKSFHGKKGSKVSLKLSAIQEREKDLSGQENKIESPEKQAEPLQRRKSFKVTLKRAASKLHPKLKTLKSKNSLNESRTAGVKRVPVLDDTSAVLNETLGKKPKLKELPWKERKKVRRMLKNNYDMIQRSKKIWEDLRRHNHPDDKKKELCKELLGMVKGNMQQFAFAHDTVRVLQCVIQYGNMDQKQEVFEELKAQMCLMAKSKYAKFLVRKFLKYGTKHHRNFIFKSFHGSVRKLVRHKEAAEVLEYAYNEYAQAPQRLALLEEFYGPSFILFKNHDTKSLDQIMLSQPDKREMILSNMKEALLPLIDKSILIHTMVHRVFYEFFSYSNEKMRSEMIEALREGVIHMLHTRDGARVAMYCIWFGTAKDRKVMIKSFKGHVEKMCKEEYGHMVLLAIMDVVDDTKLVHKALLEEMLKSLATVASNQYGRKVVLYLLSPRDPLHFHPDIVKILQEGDKNKTSKKDSKTRHRELLEGVSQPLLQYIVAHTKELVIDNSALLLILATITHATGDPSAAMEAIAKVAAEPFVAGDTDKMHIVEHPGGHMTLKRLVHNDKERIDAGEKVLFCQILLKTLPEGALKSWAACNRGCFTLLSMLELGQPDVVQTVASRLSGIKKSLKKMTFKGAPLLLQRLEKLDSAQTEIML